MILCALNGNGRTVVHTNLTYLATGENFFLVKTHGLLTSCEEKNFLR